MAFDTTTLDLILAGEQAAALARLDQGHPDEYQVTIGAAVERLVTASAATSGTTQTIGPGPLTFTLDAFHGWKAGYQVWIAEDGDPVNNYVLGALSVDETPSGDITVIIDRQVGSGTFSAWSLLLASFVTAATVAPPFSRADGGWGVDMNADPASGRAGVEVPWMKKVVTAVRTQPGSPVVGFYLVLGPSAFGADWPTHEWEIAEWDNSVWTFTMPNNGDFSITDDTGEAWIYSLPLDIQLLVGGETRDAEVLGGVIAPYAITPDHWNTGPTFNSIGGVGGRTALLVIYVWSGVLDSFVTLPDPKLVLPPGRRILIRNKSGSQKKVDVDGAATIDGSTEILIPDDGTVEFGIFSPTANPPGVDDEWTQLR